MTPSRVTNVLTISSRMCVPFRGVRTSDRLRRRNSSNHVRTQRVSALALTPPHSAWDGGLWTQRGSSRSGRGMFRHGNALRLLAIVLAVGTTLLIPALARATPTWLSAINLSDPGQDGFDPQVAVNSNGDSLVVWNRSDGSKLRIQAQFRATDGTFGPIETISASNRDASSPQVAFDGSGNAIAVWTQSDGSNGRIHAGFRPAGGSFGSDQTISPAGGTASAPQISFDSSGD